MQSTISSVNTTITATSATSTTTLTIVHSKQTQVSAGPVSLGPRTIFPRPVLVTPPTSPGFCCLQSWPPPVKGEWGPSGVPAWASHMSATSGLQNQLLMQETRRRKKPRPERNMTECSKQELLVSSNAVFQSGTESCGPRKPGKREPAPECEELEMLQISGQCWWKGRGARHGHRGGVCKALPREKGVKEN